MRQEVLTVMVAMIVMIVVAHFRLHYRLLLLYRLRSTARQCYCLVTQTYRPLDGRLMVPTVLVRNGNGRSLPIWENDKTSMESKHTYNNSNNNISLAFILPTKKW